MAVIPTPPLPQGQVPKLASIFPNRAFEEPVFETPYDDRNEKKELSNFF